MKYGYTILYVRDVPKTLAFFTQAFGFDTRFVHETGDYGELDTGTTVLAIATQTLAESILPGGITKLDELDKPAAFEIAIVTDDVAGAIKQAIEAGATLMVEPTEKPWGQTISYVKSPDGVLIEICTPVPT